MSPSEIDLRGALHDGEGDDGVDIDQILASGRARAQRRVRVLSVSAVVIVVAAAGIGGAALWGGGGSSSSNNNQESQRAAAAQAPGSPVFGSAATPSGQAGQVAGSAGSAGSNTGGGTSVPSVASAAAPDVACPTAFPRQLAPGGGSPGQFGAGGPLFAQPITSIVVCGYGSPDRAIGTSTPARLVLTGTQATALADSLENAPKKPVPVCQPAPGTAQSRVAFIGVTATGTALAAVTATVSPCGSMVTNGTAVRYDWTPPGTLATILPALTPTLTTAPGRIHPSTGPSGQVQGSPVR